MSLTTGVITGSDYGHWTKVPVCQIGTLIRNLQILKITAICYLTVFALHGNEAMNRQCGIFVQTLGYRLKKSSQKFWMICYLIIDATKIQLHINRLLRQPYTVITRPSLAR